MISYFLSGLRGARMPKTAARRGTTLHIEALEVRCVFSATAPLTIDEWRSVVFDGGITGTLPFQFTRNTETVEYDGDAVTLNQPRYGEEKLINQINTWEEAYSDLGNTEIMGTGWDHDGITPIAVLFDRSTLRMQFLRGDDLTVVNSFNLNTGSGDLLKGTVSGYRYIPQHAVIHEGLVVMMCQRERRVAGNWVVEGVSFAYTQDYGQTFTRVEQVGGGFDVPAIAGGVADGLQRARAWSFANAFPEKSADDMLGVWFPWADYIQKTGNPKGGQIGLFRARRDAVGEQWVVEPNVLVYETWRPDDSGGFHAHTAGMLTDGLASFWGDVSYRNQVVRHVAADLENYTTTTWTHQEGFHGGWSPEANKVHLLGNQAVSAAPGKDFGDILVAGDEQAESIMKVESPEEFGDKAVITKVRGSFPGTFSGAGYVGRLSIWLQHIRGIGYVSKEYTSRTDNSNAIHFSVDGESWGSLLNLGVDEPYLYGGKLIVMHEGDLHAMDLPTRSNSQAPLVLNPGGLNLATVNWSQTIAPDPGNTLRQVLYVNGLYVYADNGQPLDVQPSGAPPVANGMPMYEVTTTGSSRSLGQWDITGSASISGQLHWLSAWHYSLDGNGIAPQARIGNATGSERESVWYSNNNWVPTLDYAVPVPSSTTSTEQRLRLFNGADAAPRRWLMALEGFTQSSAPTYPLAPDVIGPNELAQVVIPQGATTSWSTALTFGLSEVSAFSSYFDPLGNGTVHTLASLYKSNDEHIDITFTRTSTAAGVLSLDVYSSGILLDKMSFKSIYWDREDQVRLVISNTSEELGVTVLVNREGYGVDSKSLVTSGTEFIPTHIRLSNATRTEVAPLEWYSIHFSGTEALTTEEREAMIVSSSMFKALDIAAQPNPPDFDSDGDIDGRDFLIWQQGTEVLTDALHADGDSNADGRVDGLDLALWQAGYGLGIPVGTPTGDFNNDGQVDDLDFAAWQAGYGIIWTYGVREQGDTNGDGDVDGRDFLTWQRQYTGPATEDIVASEPIVADDEDESPASDSTSDVDAIETLPSSVIDESLDLQAVVAVEESGTADELLANFWLSPLPISTGNRNFTEAIASDVNALRDLILDENQSQPTSVVGQSNLVAPVLVDADALAAMEIEWSTAADDVLEDWEIL